MADRLVDDPAPLIATLRELPEVWDIAKGLTQRLLANVDDTPLVVISFHTVAVSDLVDIEVETGSARRYVER